MLLFPPVHPTTEHKLEVKMKEKVAAAQLLVAAVQFLKQTDMKLGRGRVSRRQHLHSTIRRGRGEVHIFSYAYFNMPSSLVTSFSLQCVEHESTWNKIPTVENLQEE